MRVRASLLALVAVVAAGSPRWAVHGQSVLTLHDKEAPFTEITGAPLLGLLPDVYRVELVASAADGGTVRVALELTETSSPFF